VRARLNVLSELPGAWKQAIARWARVNRRGRSTVEGQSYPSRNEEYLLYQTLVGSWPAAPMTADEEERYRSRIVEYMHKAMREAKLHTNWLNPSQQHERAMTRFVAVVLATDNTAFREDFVPFAQRVARFGAYNSLAQVALKIGAPGVPDFYQGTEIWDFSLVDPDNRRPVDYGRRRALLREIDAALSAGDAASLAESAMADPLDDRLKLYATSALLRFRRSQLAIFRCGGYHPLQVMGVRRDHVFAFARTLDAGHVLVVVPRLLAGLLPDADTRPVGERIWADTSIEVPAGRPAAYRHILTNDRIDVRTDGGRAVLPLAGVFARFPVAFLEPVTER
jgi:(1->4)-alpha-D-glucan 1-alpha-D-glucosylmutase